jgi:capsular exopolysaccharide synthesis family protein
MLQPESGNQLINNGVPAGYGEAFRALRTNVLFSSAEQGSRSIVVTSTSPREGKTLVSSNLAVALAQAGMRVLLIDADMRCPRVHELFDVPQEPGLSNVLVGNAKASDAVCQSAIERLWLLPAGLHPPNPAELVGAQRFREFLEGVSQRFDWTIIDSPPLLPVTDASVMSHWASGVVFVVGSGMVSRHAAATAVEQLRAVKARCLGAILNRVDLEGQPYYYSSYYRRDYNRYYRDAS